MPPPPVAKAHGGLTRSVRRARSCRSICVSHLRPPRRVRRELVQRLRVTLMEASLMFSSNQTTTIPKLQELNPEVDALHLQAGKRLRAPKVENANSGPYQ